MKKIRILALATDAYGAGGGIAQYNRDLFGALAQSGNVKEVMVLPRKGQKIPGDLPPKVTQLAGCNGKAAYSLNALLTAKRRGPFDIIFCGHLYMAPLAVLVSKLTGAPVWLQLHGIEAWSQPSRLQRWAAERVHFVTAVSRHTRRQFLSWANCNPEMVKVLPNTVDERFCPGPKPEALLDRYQLHGKKVLLTVSRLAASERYKGHDRVIRAVAELTQRYKSRHREEQRDVAIQQPIHQPIHQSLGDNNRDIVYVIAGDGDDMPRLKLLANEFGVADRVRFIGYIPDGELPNLYRTADIFVMPSTGEGFGIVFLQALASGVPVIGGDSDGSRDPLRDGMDGRLVVAGQADAIADAIDEIMRCGETAQPAMQPFVREPFQGLVAQLVDRFTRISTQPAVL